MNRDSPFIEAGKVTCHNLGHRRIGHSLHSVTFDCDNIGMREGTNSVHSFESHRKELFHLEQYIVSMKTINM